LAIKVEERYKGIRAPHKIKGAVSGCTRECAEAQSKDFGLIATEKGWNLYVCGNGGSTPQHGKLLASDLDEETCIKFIDRFLMFYVKTAPPLMRTAKWLNKLEGGLEYLRDVVVRDSLGICADLEREMDELVGCRWTARRNDPASVGPDRLTLRLQSSWQVAYFVASTQPAPRGVMSGFLDLSQGRV
jgi:nitrite reductase (NADH) large subunit